MNYVTVLGGRIYPQGLLLTIYFAAALLNTPTLEDFGYSLDIHTALSVFSRAVSNNPILDDLDLAFLTPFITP